MAGYKMSADEALWKSRSTISFLCDCFSQTLKGEFEISERGIEGLYCILDDIYDKLELVWKEMSKS